MRGDDCCEEWTFDPPREGYSFKHCFRKVSCLLVTNRFDASRDKWEVKVESAYNTIFAWRCGSGKEYSSEPSPTMETVQPNDGQQSIHYVDAILQALVRDAEGAKQRFGMLSRMPRATPRECKTLWAEVAFCFIFDQRFAALCVCGAFVECFLEMAILDFEKKSGRLKGALPEDLAGLIKRAHITGLISEDDARNLQDFRKFIRNLAAHGDSRPMADLMFSIKAAGFAVMEGDAVTIKPLTQKQVKGLRRATTKERLDYTTEKFTAPVIRWVGKWAAECARKVYQGVAV